MPANQTTGKRKSPSAETATGAQANPDAPPSDADAAADAQRIEDLNALLEVNSQALHAFHRTNEALLMSFASFAEQMSKFTLQGLELSEQWAETLAEMQGQTRHGMGMGFDYARAATEEYFQSTQKLLDLSQSLSEDVWRPVEDSLREGLKATQDK